MRIEEKDNREIHLHDCTIRQARQWCNDNGREIVEVRNNVKSYFVTMPVFRGKLLEFYKKGGNNDRG